MSSWKIFKGNNKPHKVEKWPDTPPWRRFAGETATDETKQRGKNFIVNPQTVETVNAAIYLRRPILVTGKPGTGKTTLAYAIAHELQLGEMLVWPINTRTTRQDGLYYYDAIARLQDAQLQDNKQNIGKYIRLGALGTAMLPSTSPRVLLIDEIDKSDIDLPNDLLNLFEEGTFEITELSRLADNPKYSTVVVQTHDGKRETVTGGHIRCKQFPIVIMTSNAERDFPLPFKRRCLPLFMAEPDEQQLTQIVEAHFDYDEGNPLSEEIKNQITKFVQLRDGKERKLATDQLLNVIFMLTGDRKPTGKDKESLIERLLTSLTETGNQ
jgi:MoxR-like ATPase